MCENKQKKFSFDWDSRVGRSRRPLRLRIKTWSSGPGSAPKTFVSFPETKDQVVSTTVVEIKWSQRSTRSSGSTLRRVTQDDTVTLDTHILTGGLDLSGTVPGPQESTCGTGRETPYKCRGIRVKTASVSVRDWSLPSPTRRLIPDSVGTYYPLIHENRLKIILWPVN